MYIEKINLFTTIKKPQTKKTFKSMESKLLGTTKSTSDVSEYLKRIRYTENRSITVTGAGQKFMLALPNENFIDLSSIELAFNCVINPDVSATAPFFEDGVDCIVERIVVSNAGVVLQDLEHVNLYKNIERHMNETEQDRTNFSSRLQGSLH